MRRNVRVASAYTEFKWDPKRVYQAPNREAQTNTLIFIAFRSKGFSVALGVSWGPPNAPKYRMDSHWNILVWIDLTEHQTGTFSLFLELPGNRLCRRMLQHRPPFCQIAFFVLAPIHLNQQELSCIQGHWD